MATANKKLAWKATEGKCGKNASYTIDEKGILTVKVDLNLNLGPSASNKTNIIATSSGNCKLDGGNEAVIGLNVYRKKED